jgi:hypothetical protein
VPVACDRHRNRSVAGDGKGEPGGSSITGTGYVVESLEAALWAFDRSDSFGEGALDMLPSSEFAKFIGISPEAVVPSNSEAKFLGLKGAKVQ